MRTDDLQYAKRVVEDETALLVGIEGFDRVRLLFCKRSAVIELLCIGGCDIHATLGNGQCARYRTYGVVACDVVAFLVKDCDIGDGVRSRTYVRKFRKRLGRQNVAVKKSSVAVLTFYGDVAFVSERCAVVDFRIVFRLNGDIALKNRDTSVNDFDENARDYIAACIAHGVILDRYAVCGVNACIYERFDLEIYGVTFGQIFGSCTQSSHILRNIEGLSVVSLFKFSEVYAYLLVVNDDIALAQVDRECAVVSHVCAVGVEQDKFCDRALAYAHIRLRTRDFDDVSVAEFEESLDIFGDDNLVFGVQGRSVVNLGDGDRGYIENLLIGSEIGAVESFAVTVGFLVSVAVARSARSDFKLYPTDAVNVDFNPCVRTVGGDIRPFVCLRSARQARCVSCRYAELTENERCGRCKVTADTLFVLVQERVNYIGCAVKIAVVLHVVLGGTLDVVGDLLVHVKRIGIEALLDDYALQVNFHIVGNGGIFFFHERSVCLLFRRAFDTALERDDLLCVCDVILERIINKSFADVRNVARLYVVIAFAHRHIIRQQVLRNI